MPWNCTKLTERKQQVKGHSNTCCFQVRYSQLLCKRLTRQGKRICHGQVRPWKIWICATFLSQIGNSEFEFDSSKLNNPCLTQYKWWQCGLSPVHLICQARRERRKDHEHISKRIMSLLAGCIFQSEPDTGLPDIGSMQHQQSSNSDRYLKMQLYPTNYPLYKRSCYHLSNPILLHSLAFASRG